MSEKLTLGQVVEMPDGTWRVDEFCEEPDSGLVVLMPIDPKRGKGVIVPVSWVEGYFTAIKQRDAFEEAGDDVLNAMRGAEESIARIMIATLPGTVLAALDPLAPWFREWVNELIEERDAARKAFSKDAAGSIIERGKAYQGGLDDAGYKVCESCGETCIPTCVGCEEGKWEKASQAYFDEATTLREKLRNAEDLLKRKLEMPNADIVWIDEVRAFFDGRPAKTREELAAEHEQKLQAHLDTLTVCRAGRDGDCVWKKCPQHQDGEPVKSGRHCPLDTRDEYE